MESAYQARHTCELLVAMGGATADDEGEHLATRSVDPERPRRPVEAHASEMREQRVHSRGPRACGTTDGLADTLHLG